MHKVIDTPWRTTDKARQLKAGGVQSVIRYFNRANSRKLPEKRIEPAEAQALADAGLSLVTVFQQRGGADKHIEDLDRESGISDAKRALELADRINQPHGSAIYFAVDYDYWTSSELDKIKYYFSAVTDALQGKYRVGVYGSGALGHTMRRADLADLIWLAAARGWSGTRDMLETDEWALYQVFPAIDQPLAHDGNLISPAWHDYGQFTPGGSAASELATEDIVLAPNAVMMEVTARSGLKLRQGPSASFGVESVLPQGTMVHALGSDNGWVQVDIQGDLMADGYMFGKFLAPVSGGLPAPVQPHSPGPISVDGHTGSRSYAVALAELAMDIREVTGSGNNPRIVTYHNSTTATAGTDDSVSWCSSFVNYCVEKSGVEGTNSQWALSWEGWGQDVTGDPREGDIVVFERVGKGGHVGFYQGDRGDRVAVLGGNQGNRVKVSAYPKDGQLGDFKFRLRSIRRM